MRDDGNASTISVDGERMNEINQPMTDMEQERSDPPAAPPPFQPPSFGEIIRTTSSDPTVVYTPSSPSSAERIKKLDYTTSDV